MRMHTGELGRLARIYVPSYQMKGSRKRRLEEKKILWGGRKMNLQENKQERRKFVMVSFLQV